MHLSTWW